MATLTLRPNAAGTYQQWSTFGSPPSHHEGTSDLSDITGVQVTASITLRETENLENTLQTGTITSVKAYMRAKSPGGGGPPERAVIIWRTYGVNMESAAIVIGRTDFGDYSETRAINPVTEAAWTWDEVNALEIGSRASTLAAGETIQVSEYWIVVDYTPAGPQPGFNKLQYETEPPTPGAFNKLKYASEPPVAGAWNKILYDGE